MRSPEDIKQRIYSLSQPLFAEAGVDLVELNVRSHGAEVVVQILADFPRGGISLEQCSLLNRAIVDEIDKHKVIDGGYTLELSSPGLDRPLATPRDYLRVLHQEVRCVLKQPVAGKREHAGILKEVRDADICVETKRYGEVIIPLEHIQKAVVIF